MASSTESHTNRGSRLEKFHLIWLSDTIAELKQKHSQSFTFLETIATSFDTFSELEVCMNFLYENTREKIVLIVAGALGKDMVPIIHDGSDLHSIFVICHNKTYHEQWTQHWPKVKSVFNKIDLMCQAIEQIIQPKLEPPKEKSSRSRPTAMDNQRHRPRGQSTTVVHREPDVPKETREEITVRPRAGSSSPLINSRFNKRTTTEASDARPHVPSAFDDDERTLIAAMEQEVRQSLLVNNNDPLGASLNMHTIDHLQETFVPIIGKYVTQKKDDSNVLNRLFDDLKQVLVDALTQQQQQPVASQGVITQTVLDVLNEQKKSGATLPRPTTTELTTQRRPITLAASNEVKITADLKKTRVDATFRRECDAVVANKRLREAVQQWSSVRSVADLATTIGAQGKNNLECAWLLFCWIGQNIRYQAYCNNNSAEAVFRTREGVCRRFVSLYHQCCSLLNIECSEISGYAKQAFLKPGEKLNQSPHAWNTIVLDQYTYLIDPTWGVGGRDNENKLEDFHFLTSPEEFIYTHYTSGNQLIEPEITKEQFLSLPVMTSTYHRLGLTLLSPKQGSNDVNQNLFKIVIRTPEQVDLFLQLKVNNIEYPQNLHTLCQRDEMQSDLYNCYIAPPLNGLYDVAIFAKKNEEKVYQQAIAMRLRVLNIADAFAFPLIYSVFTEHHGILIEPLQRLVYKNEEVLIHMIISHAHVLKIQNGDDYIVPDKDEYKRGVLRKKVRVQGDLQICARWDDNADTIQVLCVFNMFEMFYP